MTRWIYVNKERVFPGDCWSTPIGRLVIREFREGVAVVRQVGSVVRVMPMEDLVFLVRQGELLEGGDVRGSFLSAHWGEPKQAELFTR